MLPFPPIDPIALQLGPLAIRWYGLAYLTGIGCGWWLLARRAHADPAAEWTPNALADLIFYAAIGGVLGGRLGYVLFYNFREYFANPLELLAVWRGGMSFHGGLLGGALGLWWFVRAQQRSFLATTDFFLPVVPIGLGLGRLANFVNQELWGAPTQLPWGVLFTAPLAGPLPRHPSQLYEALLEGLLLYGLLAWFRRRSPRTGMVTAVFLLGYAGGRLAVELVREPDPHLGYLWGGWLTLGQVLCLPMLLAGVGLVIRARLQPPAGHRHG
ncbi:MAG: prolipoprotein diacylglyceryl transferase [Gammaproteobacteria bacterium]|nr:prolipoprotein diacylglyceryl transferase [Gammaproteobacteria bacterium]